MSERDVPAVGVVDVRRHRDGSWTWRYRDGGGTEIIGNRVFRTRQGAVASARHAYPGVPIQGGIRQRVRPPRPPVKLLAAVGIAGAAAGALLVVRRLRREVRIRPVGPG